MPKADKIAEWEKKRALEKIPEANSVEFLQEFVSLEQYDGRDWSFDELTQRKIELDQLLKDGEELKKWIGDQLLFALGASECEQVRLEGGYILKVGHGRSPSKIEPTKLLEQGVTVDQIKAATIDGSPYSFAQIVVPKEGKGE